MLVKRRVLAFAVVVAAAVVLCWAAGRSAEPAGLTSGSPSASSQKASSPSDPAVVESRTTSFVRGLTGDKPSQSELPWELLIACGLAGIAAAALWTRLSATDRSSFERLRILRSTVALRAPPSSQLL